MDKKFIRNVAIIAHVDHGKTTLVDQLLKKSNTLEARDQLEERAMDNNDLERERGITILAKNTAIRYKDYKINILDTPGHADFSGEVERIMKMVDGVVLVVDAYEGTMPQTRFVLKKAFEAHLKPIVVINKVDKPSARPDEVVDEILELFFELGANDNQLEFKVAFASATHGTSSLNSDPSTQEPTMNYILDLIVSEIPAPEVEKDGSFALDPELVDENPPAQARKAIEDSAHERAIKNIKEQADLMEKLRSQGIKTNSAEMKKALKELSDHQQYLDKKRRQEEEKQRKDVLPRAPSIKKRTATD